MLLILGLMYSSLGITEIDKNIPMAIILITLGILYIISSNDHKMKGN